MGKHRPLIDEIAPQWKLDPDLLEAIVYTESSGNPNARRYEPHQDRVADGDTPGKDDGPIEDDASYGLMQIMGTTARRLGFTNPDFTALYDPRLSITFACKLMQQLLRKSAGRYDVALARYNGGFKGNPRKDGTLRNQPYVDKVMKFYERIKRGEL